MDNHGHHEPLPFFGIVLILVGLVAVAPGTLIAFVCDHVLRLGCARDQLWAWSCVASLGVLIGLRVALGGWLSALGRYAALSIAVVAFIALARYGLHAEWPTLMMSAFLGR